MKKTALVIMAAGIGSRFGGGVKQLEPVGPGGEIIMDYSIHDALEAGFDRIVFIIRRDLERDFKEIIGRRIERIAPVSYAYQETGDVPEGFAVPEGRKKPWGTGHAVLSIKGIVKEPFAVINADDYYGKEAFVKLHEYMVNEMDEGRSVYDICMGGFILANTLSENGGVTRGVCEVGADGLLRRVTETYNIVKTERGLIASDQQGNPASVRAEQYVSMNMWGIPASFLNELENGFPQFLSSLEAGDVKSEYLLPAIIDQMIHQGRAEVKVLETRDRWFGVTYKEDKAAVAEALQGLVRKGVYQEPLFQ